MGLPYLVGEHGPEIMVPHANSQVLTHEALKDLGGGGNTYNYYTLPSDEFWANVDGRASAHSMAAISRERQHDTRKQHRRFGK